MPVRALRLALLAVMAALGAVLAGCPQERPADKQIPPQRTPPAAAVESPPARDGGAPASRDGSVRPSR